MEYSTTKTKRNWIILSASFLILYVLVIRLYFFFASPESISPVQHIILNLVFLIPYAWLMLVFFSYFRHYRLKVLQVSVVVILVLEILFKANLFRHIFESTGEKMVFLTASVILLVTTIIFIVFLFRPTAKDCPGILSVRKYAISSALFAALSITVPFFTEPAHTFATQQLVELLTAIPYIFIIDFALKFPR